MRRDSSHRRPAAGNCRPGSTRIVLFDARLLALIVTALATLAALLPSEPGHNEGPSRVSPGEVGTQISAFAMSPSNGEIATIDYGGRIKLRSRGTEWQTERQLYFPGRATALAYSTDGRFLAAGGSAGGVCLWDLSLPLSEPTEIVTVPVRRVQRISFSPDGRSLVIAALGTGTIVVWDIRMQRERRVFDCGTGINKIDVSADGRWLVTAASGQRWTLALWDLESGSQHLLAVEGPGIIAAVAFSPDGSSLASASVSEHYVRLWDLKSRRVRRLFTGHTRAVNSVAFSPDGTLLATAANDGTLGIWTVATGQRLARLECDAVALRNVSFSPDGRTLVVTTDGDDDIRWWDLAELFGWKPRAKYGQSQALIQPT
jgi:WD40 repeat protein